MPSTSKSQQRLMGVAYAVKTGDMQLSDVDAAYRDKVKDLVDGMTEKQIKDFAKTKHKGLPEKKIKESMSHFKPFKDYVNEAYDGNMSDFKYEFPIKFEDVTGNSTKAIKKMSKKGKGYEVRTSIYMSRPEMDKVGRAMGLKLIDYKKDSRIAVSLYEGSIEETFTDNVINENYEVIFSDGVSQIRKFRTESQAIDFMKKEIKSNKKLKEIAVYKPGMHSTTQTELVVAFWGDRSYLDNVSKRDADLAAKKFNESIDIEESVQLNEWGSSDQSAMNKSIHDQIGKPRNFVSPFDSKLRRAASDAVDFYWDDWPEYKRNRAGLIDDAVRAYLRGMFPKEWSAMVKMFESTETVNEEYVELPGIMVPAEKLAQAYSKWYRETARYWEDFSDDMVEDSADEAARNAQMEILAYLSNKMNNVIKDKKMKVNMDLK